MARDKRYVLTSLWVRPDQLNTLFELKMLYGRPQSEMMRRALDEFIEREKKKVPQ